MIQPLTTDCDVRCQFFVGALYLVQDRFFYSGFVECSYHERVLAVCQMALSAAIDMIGLFLFNG